ncbi:MAG TPA: HAD family phosphatase [Eubacteriaceae bacterium]|nr:HAD family phosphatase [Eubacteriaceae bacterium]
MDGTLLDSIPIWSKVGELFLNSQDIVPPSDLKEALKEKTLIQAVEYFIERFDLTLTQEEILLKINDIIGYHYRNTIPLKPFVREFLDYLKNRGIIMCIATLSNKSIVKDALEKHDIASFFEFVLTSGEVGVGKDQPDIYLQACQRLGFNIEDVVVFEDSPYCIKTAQKAGFKVVGVYDERNKSRVEEMKGYCDYFIYTFKEIEGLNIF